MKPSRLLFVLTAVLLTIAPVAADFNPVRYVNPFIGTDFHGHTFPGAVVPFGMVQLSPDTRLSGWDGCSGYHYSDSVIYGFSHTHLSGTGASDYGDVLLMPVIGISQGAQPIIGYNFGARQFDRVIRTLTLATVAAVTVSFLGYLWIELFPETIILLFNDSPGLMAVGVPGIRIYLALVPVVAYFVYYGTTYFLGWIAHRNMS